MVPAPVKASSVERALIGQTLNQENITVASNQVANDLGSDVIGDLYASGEYRRAMAAVEIRHALFHITGAAHVGSRAVSGNHRVQDATVNREAIPVSDPATTKPKAAGNLNAELAGKKAYSKIDEKMVTSWQGLRNSAAHGKYDEYSKEQIQLMLEGVGNFLARNAI